MTEPPQEDNRHRPEQQQRPDYIGAQRPRHVRPQRPSLFKVAPVSMTILGICIAVFLVFNMAMLDRLVYLTFSPANGLLFPGIITHMFAHGDMLHLLTNMFVLFFLGVIVEERYKAVNYLALYIISGLIAALAQAVVAPGGFLLGASGALAGVMAAFVRHYPKVRLYLYAILPLPAWLVITGWMLFNIYGASSGAAGVAFVAHIAGFAAGMVLSFIIEPPRRRPKHRQWPGHHS